jgi:hypothetical protein
VEPSGEEYPKGHLVARRTALINTHTYPTAAVQSHLPTHVVDKNLLVRTFCSWLSLSLPRRSRPDMPGRLQCQFLACTCQQGRARILTAHLRSTHRCILVDKSKCCSRKKISLNRHSNARDARALRTGVALCVNVLTSMWTCCQPLRMSPLGRETPFHPRTFQRRSTPAISTLGMRVSDLAESQHKGPGYKRYCTLSRLHTQCIASFRRQVGACGTWLARFWHHFSGCCYMPGCLNGRHKMSPFLR